MSLLRFTVTAWEADSADCRMPGPFLERVAAVRLYGAECAPLAQVRLIRGRPTQPGPDTFQVWDDSCASYFIAVVDSAGNESCWVGTTVGITPTSVAGLPVAQREVFYDIQGRRVTQPLRSGIYYSSRVRRRIVVLK